MTFQLGVKQGVLQRFNPELRFKVAAGQLLLILRDCLSLLNLETCDVTLKSLLEIVQGKP